MCKRKSIPVQRCGMKQKQKCYNCWNPLWGLFDVPCTRKTIHHSASTTSDHNEHMRQDLLAILDWTAINVLDAQLGIIYTWKTWITMSTKVISFSMMLPKRMKTMNKFRINSFSNYWESSIEQQRKYSRVDLRCTFPLLRLLIELFISVQWRFLHHWKHRPLTVVDWHGSCQVGISSLPISKTKPRFAIRNDGVR